MCPYSSGTERRRTPGCLRGRSCPTARRTESRVRSSLSRVTPSAASERFSELLGCPISCPSLASCVSPEPRPLPSAGITQLHRYYGPLRHPEAPGPSLAGVRLIITDHPSGLPVLRALPLCTCRRHYPGAATGCFICSLPQPVSAFPGMAAGSARASTFSRLVQRSLALQPAHSQLPPSCGSLHRRLQPFRCLHSCSGCFRLEHLAGWDLHPLGKRRLSTAHANSGHLSRTLNFLPSGRWTSTTERRAANPQTLRVVHLFI
jgi:hypothetical protein